MSYMTSMTSYFSLHAFKMAKNIWLILTLSSILGLTTSDTTIHASGKLKPVDVLLY